MVSLSVVVVEVGVRLLEAWGCCKLLSVTLPASETQPRQFVVSGFQLQDYQGQLHVHLS